MSWRRFFRRAFWDRDRAEELRSYLEIETEENIARGMSSDAARRAAHLKLGNTVRIREEIYRMNTISPLETFGRDLRLALRGMRRRPGVHAGGRPHARAGHRREHRDLRRRRWRADQAAVLPERRRARQHQAGCARPQRRASSACRRRSTSPIATRAASFSTSVCTVTAGRRSPESASRSRRARCSSPTTSCRHWASSRSSAGSSQRPTRHPARSGATFAPVVILTHAYWQRRFGGDRSVIGRRLIADSNPVEVIGVMPEGFRFLDMEPAAEVIALITFDRSGLRIGGLRLFAASPGSNRA